MKKTLLVTALSLCALSFPATTFADEANIIIHVQLLNPTDGNKDIGKVTVTESKYGLVFTPELRDLTPGLHGFHIHQNPSCDAKEQDGKTVAGLSAGGHWDPNKTERHGFPWEDNAHLGDLPALTVNQDGSATNPVLAPRLKKLEQIKGRAIMIHAGGDNHSDHPAPLGGGGARMACGVIQ
ncbi:superoxide dismutase [Chelonobacter oris]|uniref:Superoxide dismutase [Cu-Zn] n=1 Tax=Chelonobacter oris TaxID=505317 RepID=A0A0A3AQ28_9PAST|nr:superoxide dismutase family protein [Chelonobacter oris]KGQ71523.1 superoxide dismutase [Chelonobacter oris]